jgi:hypothetical protein
MIGLLLLVSMSAPAATSPIWPVPVPPANNETLPVPQCGPYICPPPPIKPCPTDE